MELTNIKGVGPKTLPILKEKGIVDIPSLVGYIPSSYQVYKLTGFDYYTEMNVEGLVVDEIKFVKLKKTTKYSFNVSIEGLIFNVVFFGMDYLKNIIKINTEIVIIGKYDQDFKSINASKIFLKKDYKEGIFPEYNIDGINNPSFQKIVNEALKEYDVKKTIIPDEYFVRNGYKSGKELFLTIHNPQTIEDTIVSRSALKYYELLIFSIKMALIRKNIMEELKTPKSPDLSLVKDFIKSIEFDLTNDQKNAVNEIFIGLKSNHPLNALLEGDVGSGKTIVAIISTYANYTANYQSLVIAPTEALASQHYLTFKKYLEKFNVNVELITSSTKDKDKNIIYERLSNGDIDIIIGTHSLLNDKIIFKNLGLIICDEQHKFGVEQRKIIREKGNNPDVLYMTATPIPRTLSLTLFNDMKLITIKEVPKDRKRIITKIHTYKDYLKVLDFVKSEINEGRQAYFVSPLIDNNDESASAIKVKEDLDKYFIGYKIGLLHGKMSSAEKEDVISKFMNGEIDILSSTTVIEVGINNPNASVMVIIDAANFGLSTLHQLRGRVGRGKDTGYAFLMVEKKESFDKLKILEETQDGFLISEEDLRLRGPGDFLGVNQSGRLKFNYANIVYDKDILKVAMKDAEELIKIDKIKDYYSSNLYNDNFD